MKEVTTFGLITLTCATLLPGNVRAADAAKSASTDRSIWYASLSAGPNLREDALDEPARLKFDVGVAVAGAVGVRLERLENKFLSNIRLEFEYERQFDNTHTLQVRNTIPWGDFGNNPEQASRGRIDVESFQFVVAYDFPLRKFAGAEEGSFLGRLVPFVGMGLGADHVIINDLGSPLLDTYIGPGGFHMSTTSSLEFCFSPRFGLTYEITRHLDAFLMGVYHYSERVEVVDPFGSHNHPNAATWAAMLGVRYNF